MLTNSINSNTTLGIQRQIGSIQNRLSLNFQRLSSGRRVNNASDDAASLAIGEKLSALVSGMTQASRNVDDGISLAQVSDGAMASQGDMLVRMRELAVQAGNGTLNDSDRAALQDEFSALQSEVDRVAQGTNFNGTSLLQGGSVNMQVGVSGGSGDQIAVPTPDTTAAALGVNGANIGTQGGAQTALDDIDAAISQLSNSRADVGAVVNRLESTRNNLGTSIENTASSLSRLVDLDVAGEFASMSANSVQLRAAIATHRQANNTKGLLVNLLK